MSERYSRGVRILFPNFDWKHVGIGSQDAPIDEDALMKQMLTWRAFSECQPL